MQGTSRLTRHWQQPPICHEGIRTIYRGMWGSLQVLGSCPKSSIVKRDSEKRGSISSHVETLSMNSKPRAEGREWGTGNAPVGLYKEDLFWHLNQVEATLLLSNLRTMRSQMSYTLERPDQVHAENK